MDPLHLAIALTQASIKNRLQHRERIRLLEACGGLEGLIPFLEIQKKKSRPKETILLSYLRLELASLDKKRYPPGWQVLEYQTGAYPKRLRHTSCPPALLFVSGKGLDLLNQTFLVGMVGSRKPSEYGRKVTRLLASELAKSRIPVLSGGARGIDSIAHEEVLASRGRTAAVLGNGLGRTYPPENGNLFSRIEEEGLLITEYPPWTPPKPTYFPARNRILAGLCDALIVTEASASSGTLITAGFAADYGREVLAVPGSILTGKSQSCHTLIKEGAALIERVSDIPGFPFKDSSL